MKTSFALCLVVVTLFSLGLLMIFNTAAAEELVDVRGLPFYLSTIKQLAFFMVGLLFAFVLYKLGYEYLIEKSPLLFLGCFLMLALVLVPKVGMYINGARRWINIGGISLQPSEFAKVVIPLFYMKLYGGEKGFTTAKRFFLAQLPFMALILLVLLEPDNGTGAILIATLVVSYFITRVSLLYWFLPMAIFVSCGVTLALSMKHVNDRIHVYLHPEADLLGKGHQPFQAKIAAGSGGIFGRGLGESLQKYQYLPEARSDYIAAIYAEEFGFIGMVFLITLYMILAMLGFRIASKCSDEKGVFLATIFTFIITFQAFLNLGVVSGLLPSKGTNLPFFSQGGSSLWGNIFLVTLLLNICQKSLRHRKGSSL
jgi:cell division protein FtsW